MSMSNYETSCIPGNTYLYLYTYTLKRLRSEDKVKFSKFSKNLFSHVSEKSLLSFKTNPKSVPSLKRSDGGQKGFKRIMILISGRFDVKFNH